MPSRATTAAAPAPVQQAPMDPMFVQNRFDKGATYIPGLYQPGMRGYDAQYGGGGWARLGTGTTADQLKAKLASDFASGQMVTSPQDLTNTLSGIYGKGVVQGSKEQQGIDALMASDGLDYRNATGLQRQQYMLRYAQENGLTGSTTGGADGTAATPQKSYKDIKSIGGGLKIGGDNILGRREAMKIARGTGKGYDDVITKALGRGMSIGGGAVRQSNRAYEKSGQALMDRAMGGLTGESPLSEMRRVNPGKRQMFSGTYQLDGQTMPLIESRRGGVASNLGGMTAGGGRRRGGKGKGKGRRGRGGAGDMGGADMGTMPQTSMADYIPPAMDEPLPEQDININMPGVGENVFSSATGFRSKRSSRKRAGRQAAGLASQRVNPTGSWRYGV